VRQSRQLAESLHLLLVGPEDLQTLCGGLAGVEPSPGAPSRRACRRTRGSPRRSSTGPFHRKVARKPRRFSGSGGIACPTALIIVNILCTQTFFREIRRRRNHAWQKMDAGLGGEGPPEKAWPVRKHESLQALPWGETAKTRDACDRAESTDACPAAYCRSR
jgi:hypothetical protein